MTLINREGISIEDKLTNNSASAMNPLGAKMKQFREIQIYHKRSKYYNLT